MKLGRYRCSMILTAGFILFCVQMIHAQQIMSPGDRVAAMAIKMINEGQIIIGSCWDFINAAYNRAGYTSTWRTNAFKKVKGGAYANPEVLRPGDWVMHYNDEYNGIEHSAIFIRWIDRQKHIAQMADYVGEKRQRPPQYSEHSMNRIFQIIRPKARVSSGVK